MRRILFVANGHGETAIAARIGGEIATLSAEPVALDLLALVGTGAGAEPLTVVGPRRAMPSGGLVAMGNVRAILRDLRAGFAGLLAAQIDFLLRARSRYEIVVAVGDAYALALAFLTRTRTVFVGTAKSVYVAPYGPFERTLLRRAARAFVRDAPTAQRLLAANVDARAAGNTIVDLVDPEAAPARAAGGQPPRRWIGILPGSREEAYADGVRLARTVRELGLRDAGIGGLFSIAPTLEAGRFAHALSDDGWALEAAGPNAPFEAQSGTTRLVGWSGSLGALLAASVAVLGQAGTANEQAAGCGVPVIALGAPRAGRDEWYRMRQRRLLGDALLLASPDPAAAAAESAELLGDEVRLQDMRAAGRARMGGRGATAAIAREILELA